MAFSILGQSSGPVIDFIIEDYYNELADISFDVFESLTLVTYTLAFAGLILQAYKVGFGDFSGIVRNMIAMGIVAASLRFFPDLIFGAQELFGYRLLQEINVDPVGLVTEGVTGLFDDFMGNFTGDSVLDTVFNIISLEFIFETIINILAQIIFAIVAIIGWLLMIIGFLVQIVALYMGVAASPIFIGMLLYENTRETGVKYITGLIAICIWPLGWGLGMIVSDALISGNFFDSLPISAAAIYVQPWIDLLVGIVALIWMILVVLKTPKIISKAITTGSQIGAGFASEAISFATAAGGSVITVAGAAAGAAVGADKPSAGGSSAIGASTAGSNGSIMKDGAQIGGHRVATPWVGATPQSEKGGGGVQMGGGRGRQDWKAAKPEKLTGSSSIGRKATAKEKALEALLKNGASELGTTIKRLGS